MAGSLLLGLLMPASTYAQPAFSDTIRATIAYTGGDEGPYGTTGRGEYSLFSTSATSLSQVDRPLIIVEGWDPFNSLDGQEIFDLFNLSTGDSLATRLLNEGYDIIVLDFQVGGFDYIQRNAYVLVELLNQVNLQKMGSEQVVVAGVSMGGLVGRYALSYMEYHNLSPAHNCRMFITYDTPNQGAFVPFSIQFALARTIGDNIATSVTVWKKMFERSAQQMLMYWVDPTVAQNTSEPNQVLTPAPHSRYNAFYSELAALGNYPANCRLLAVANGNKSGREQLNNALVPFTAQDAIAQIDRTNSFLGEEKHTCFLAGNDPSNHARIDVMQRKVNGSEPFTFVWRPRDINAKGMATGGNLNHLGTCAGSRNTIIEQLGAVGFSGFHMNFPEPNLTFIPTVSALDLTETDLAKNLTPVPDVMDQTPFDAIYAPINANLSHIDLALEASNWLFDEITRQGQPLVITNFRSFNHGNNTNNLLFKEYRVENGGVLSFNRNQNTGYYNSNPVGLPMPVPNDVSDFYLVKNSGARIIVEDQGQLRVGDENNAGFTANVHLQEGAKLEIQDGGRLVIAANSSLTVKDGAEIEFKDGAIIELPYASSVLEIQGKLIVEAGADFTFSGNGHIVFNQAVPSGSSGPDLTNYMDIGSGATFTLQGPVADDNNHLLMEIHKPLYLRDENGNFFSQLTLEDGTIAIKGGALLYNYSPVSMTHMKFTNISGTGDHGGYRMWSNSGVNTIEHNEFEHGNPGFMMQWIGGGATPRVRYNNFHDNQVGFHAVGGNFWITDCDFNTNYDGVRGENLSGTSKIIGNDFNGGGVSLEEAQSGSFVYLTDNLIENSSYGLNIYGANTEVRASCNVFQGNSNPVLMQYGALHMNNEAGNQFLNNSSGQEIHVIGEDDSSTPQVALYMKDGYNTFVNPGQSCSPPYVKFDWDFTTERTTGNELDWNNNQLPVCDPGVTNTTGFYIPVKGGYSHYTTFPVYIPNNLTNPHLSACDNFASPPDHPYIGLLQYINNNGGLIGGDPNDPLKGGVINGLQDISHGETINEDLTALGTLTGVLNASISNTDAHTDYIRDVALKGLMQSLNNAYEHEELTHNEGDPEGTVVEEMQDVIDILDDFIMDLGEIDSTNAFSYFRYHLDKVHACRVGGYYAEALSILSSSSSWTFNYTQQMRVSYWDCICTAENDYYTGELSAEGLASAVSGCNETYQGYNYKRQPEEVTAKVEAPVEIFEFYPQPVKERLKLYLQPRPDRTVSYRIFNSSGNLIRKGEINWSADEQEIDVSSLPLGMYVTVLEAGTRTERFKFVKE